MRELEIFSRKLLKNDKTQVEEFSFLVFSLRITELQIGNNLFENPSMMAISDNVFGSK
jgi:hypothetical protein